MWREFSLFVGTFTTLLAIINPLEVLPVYLKLLAGADDAEHRAVAWKSCFYALLLCFFFLIFGRMLLRLCGVPLSMVRIVGGIILMKIGFRLFSSQPQASKTVIVGPAANIAFVPLAMPHMFGPGAIATVLGITSTIRQQSQEEISSFAAVAAAIVATLAVTYLCLASPIRSPAGSGRSGSTRRRGSSGFSVSAIGAGLIFDSAIEALETHGLKWLH